MSNIYKSAEELVGKTPLMELSNIEKKYGLKANVLAKLELFNPAGSVKDRIALSIIKEAEKKGLLKKGSVIIEPTSGNTGIGLASVGAVRGYRVILVMPSTMSIERIKLAKAYGAEVVLTDGKLGMKGSLDKAEELKKSTPGSIIAGQFINPANPKAHYEGTGPEIWADTDGKVDILVSGVGTGGTLSGTGKYLKEKNPDIKIVAVEPETSPLLSKGVAGPHKIQGIGANFIPEILDRSLIDEVIDVPDEEAFKYAKEMGKTEGILIGISAGAAIYAAKLLAQREENKGKTIVAVLPDGGDRYYSTPVFEN